jgi:hypothetical protein
MPEEKKIEVGPVIKREPPEKKIEVGPVPKREPPPLTDRSPEDVERRSHS